MIWSAIDIAKILETILRNSNLMSKPNAPKGRIYLNQRPTGSQDEDLVINTGHLAPELWQIGDVYVHAYAKNQVRQIDGKVDESMPDMDRLDEITDTLKPYLTEILGRSWNYELVNTRVRQAEANQHFVEFRLAFRGIYSEDTEVLNPVT